MLIYNKCLWLLLSKCLNIVHAKGVLNSTKEKRMNLDVDNLFCDFKP